MHPMYLQEIEQGPGSGTYADRIALMRSQGKPMPQIWHLFAFKPDRTDFLAHFTQGVMRGPSPLSAGLRELIAALTSKRNDCDF